MKTTQTAFFLLLSRHSSDAFTSIHSNTRTATATTSNTILFSASDDSNNLLYASAGAPTVDMNKYNIPLSQSINEWTAVIQTATSMQEEGIFLQPKNKRDLFLDTLQYTVKREGGLGLLLTEIAGGREDGVGITIVEQVLEGGNAMGSGIMAGDSIVAIAVDRNSGGGLNDKLERIGVATECLGYDATIEALTSLPPPTSSEDEIILTVKRIRKQPKVNVKLQYPPYLDEPDTYIELFAGENLRRAMLTRGIKLNDKLSERFDSGGTGDCGADGTCATCVVSVTKGGELLSPMKMTESQILSKKPRWRMACKTVVGYGMMEGDLTIQVNPRQWEN